MLPRKIVKNQPEYNRADTVAVALTALAAAYLLYRAFIPFLVEVL